MCVCVCVCVRVSVLRVRVLSKGSRTTAVDLKLPGGEHTEVLSYWIQILESFKVSAGLAVLLCLSLCCARVCVFCASACCVCV